MKTLTTVLAASAALSGSILAGEHMAPIDHKKMVIPAIECYGTGWYGANQGGVNLYQDTGGSREFTTRRGNRIKLDSGDNIGGFGGLKLGYVFGTGSVRPAFEADIYYNGIDADVDVSVNGDSRGNIGARIDSIAFMGNALLKFGCDKFQPYLGFGLGYHVKLMAHKMKLTGVVFIFEPDVALCDVQLPGADGLELLDRLLRVRPDTLVMMITAYGTVETAVSAFRRGAQDYLLKPVIFDELLAKIDRHFAPARERRKQLVTDPGQVEEVLSAGAKRAREVAQVTLRLVRQAVGIQARPTF